MMQMEDRSHGSSQESSLSHCQCGRRKRRISKVNNTNTSAIRQRMRNRYIPCAKDLVCAIAFAMLSYHTWESQGGVSQQRRELSVYKPEKSLSSFSRMPSDLAEAVDVILRVRMEQKKEAIFVKFGASNGVDEEDVLQKQLSSRKNQWTGFVIEHQSKFVKDMVAANSTFANWNFVHATFADEGKCKDGFTTVCEKNSIQKNGEKNNNKKKGEDAMREITLASQPNKCTGKKERVSCISSMNDLISNHANERIKNQFAEGCADNGNSCSSSVDLLQINLSMKDGFSKMMDLIHLNELAPQCIHYASAPSDTDQNVAITLISRGYQLQHLEGGYTLACMIRSSRPLMPFAYMPSYPDEALDLILDERGEQRALATLVEIGDGDGGATNPVVQKILSQRDRWAAVQAEMQPGVVQSLISKQGRVPSWTYFGGVVADQNQCLDGYANLCEYTAPSSFFLRTKKKLILDFETCRQLKGSLPPVKRPCLPSMQALVQEYGGTDMRLEATVCDGINGACTTHVDLLVLDISGNSYDMIKKIDLDKFVPHCIYYRSKLLDTRQMAAANYLMSRGYSVRQEDENFALACIALQDEVPDLFENSAERK